MQKILERWRGKENENGKTLRIPLCLCVMAVVDIIIVQQKKQRWKTGAFHSPKNCGTTHHLPGR